MKRNSILKNLREAACIAWCDEKARQRRGDREILPEENKADNRFLLSPEHVLRTGDEREYKPHDTPPLSERTDFDSVAAAQVQAVEDWINGYPREILGYKSASFKFAEAFPEAA